MLLSLFGRCLGFIFSHLHEEYGLTAIFAIIILYPRYIESTIEYTKAAKYTMIVYNKMRNHINVTCLFVGEDNEMIIDPKDYPSNKDWDTKVFSVPNLPRGDVGSVDVLRQILEMVKKGDPTDKMLEFSGSSSNITLDDACVRLRPMNLVHKTENGWKLTDESSVWLDSGDDLYLAALLCANIKFLAEILFFLDAPRTAAQLFEIAITEYDMNWKTTSVLNSRLVWLRGLNLVDFQQFSLLYSITETGRDFLSHVKIVSPTEVTKESDETEGEENIKVSEWAIDYHGQSRLNERKSIIGYVPGKFDDYHHTISEYLKIIKDGADFPRIEAYTTEKYGIAYSSLRSFFINLTNLKLISRMTDSKFEVTDIADYWLQEKNIVDLVICFDVCYKFVLDLLHEVKNRPMTYKELAAKARVSYGLEKESSDEMRKRVAILKAAKLVVNASADKYIISNRGMLLTSLFPVSSPTGDGQKGCLPKDDKEDTESLLRSIRLASRDSTNPTKFELEVKKAFEKIGFKATSLGGSGKTDVLIQACGAPEFSFTVAVDTKSTASGNVSDGLVDFDTLDEHKKKHRADYSCIVGCSFQSERLVKRAIEHHVSLIDIDMIEELIKGHEEVPLMVTSYKLLFDQDGIIDLSVLNKEREQKKRSRIMMQSVMECLLKESRDSITKGLLQERDIYRSLRDNDAFREGIQLSEISEMLAFLSSPLVGCLGKDKDYYYAIGSLADATNIFGYFSRMST